VDTGALVRRAALTVSGSPVSPFSLRLDTSARRLQMEAQTPTSRLWRPGADAAGQRGWRRRCRP
jgi:hypothetical protein